LSEVSPDPLQPPLIALGYLSHCVTYAPLARPIQTLLVTKPESNVPRFAPPQEVLRPSATAAITKLHFNRAKPQAPELHVIVTNRSG